MKTNSPTRSTHIYLLRLERVQRGSGTTWFAFLEPVASGQRRAFGSFDALSEFLKRECEELEPERKSLSNAEGFSAYEHSQGRKK